MHSNSFRCVVGCSLTVLAGVHGLPLVRALIAASPREANVASDHAIPAQSAPPIASTVRLARIFSDGMVLQRNAPLPVWGWATPGASILVRLGAEAKRTTAKADSSWQVTFSPRPAGNPVELSASVTDAREVVRNVVFGDVWVASGQSNMEWSLSLVRNGAAEIASASDSNLREYKVPNTWSWDAEKDLAGGKWNITTPATAGSMSGVAYFFARELRSTVKVPIGIVNTAWSGAAIDPYMSRTALKLDDIAWQNIKTNELQYKQRVRDSLEQRLGKLPTVDEGMINGEAVWAAAGYDDGAWRTIRSPGAWERNGYAGLDGVVWLRRTFTLSAADARQGARLSLATIDDDDVTWINGVEVGRTSGYALQRSYTVPAAALREGSNVLVVRISDGSGDGGIIGDSSQVFIQSGNTRQTLAGDWKFRVGRASFSDDGQHINKIPAILYNRMMSPIARLPFTGVIWYQGESNANNDAQAQAYREKFATMIQSWRKELNGGRGDFAFLWAQLPNYGRIDATPPSNAGWAYLRESQAAALSLPNTGQAVTIDVGEATNLHPTNKQDVGKRLALIARAMVYKQPVEFSGPVCKNYRVDGKQIALSFTKAAGLKTAVAGDSVRGFAIAGADRQWKWANARISGNTVTVWSDEVSSPVAVRYAWGNSPRDPNLYNGAGLPAAPFRTDRW